MCSARVTVRRGSQGLAVAVSMLALAACSAAFNGQVPEPAHDARPPHAIAAPDFPVDVTAVIASLGDGSDAAMSGFTDDERAEVRALYERDHAALWLDGGGRPTRNLRDALTLLNHAAEEGLDPMDYDGDALQRLTASVDAGAAAAGDAARLDVAVSAAVLRYLRDLHAGRVDPRSIGLRLDAPRDRADFAALLHRAIDRERVVNLAADLRPPLAHYTLLRSLLPRYRSLAADPTLVGPPATTRAIHPGDIDPDTLVLAHLLIALGDLPAAAATSQASRRYEGAVVGGVRHFQARHGLEPDGVLGGSTVDALRVPLRWRVRQIELSLERLRWLPRLGSERLIVANIPMFRLWAWDAAPADGASRFGMDVIVGRALSTQTPVFAAQMGEVVFRPYWNVPQSILHHDVLPKLERDPDYLRREDMEIVRGAGDGAERVDLSPDALAGLRQGALRLRQRPGARNALGPIEFVFPNREDIYMHGTPAQSLFTRSRRDFSHGCVRVADPEALAEWVLQDRPEWTHDRIVAAARGARTIHVRLSRPVQVILFYTSATAMPEDGTIHFAEDIYRQDARLDRALDGLHRSRIRLHARAGPIAR